MVYITFGVFLPKT